MKMRNLLLGCASLLMFLAFLPAAFAQPGSSAADPLPTTVENIQRVRQTALDSCNDLSPLNNQWVRVRGVVLIPGVANVSSSDRNPNRHVWMRDLNYNGPFSAIGFRQSGNTSPVDMRDLNVGDTIEVVGRVGDFTGESQLGGNVGGVVDITSVNAVSLYEPGSPRPQAIPLQVGDFNDANLINRISTGEAWEGNYVALQNVRVIAVDRFFASNASRVSFTVQDAAGNRINIGDRFFAQRLPNCSTSPINLCGNFVPPSVGDEFRQLRGIILHNKSTNAPDCSPIAGRRGYELHPFDSLDYEKGRSAPFAITINNSPYKPTSSDNTVITVETTPGTDSLGRRANITRAMLYWTRLPYRNHSTTVITYSDSIALTQVGITNVYTATIPAQADSSVVAYYISLSNDQGLTSNFTDPVIVNTSNGRTLPNFYYVFNRDLRISDVQENVFTRDNIGGGVTNMISPANGRTLTVTGVVTADTTLNNVIFIQDPINRRFGGLMIRSAVGSSLFRNVRLGQTVSVTGTILEEGQMTYMNATALTISTTEPINRVIPINVSIADLGVSRRINGSDTVSVNNWNISRENLEGQLVRIFSVNPSEGLLVNVANFRTTTANTAVGANFGEWTVNSPGFNQALDGGVVVVSGFAPSASRNQVTSLYNPYINYTGDTLLRVSPVVIDRGFRLHSITGIVYHSFGNLKLIPRDAGDVWLTPTSTSGRVNNGVSVFPNPAKDQFNVNLSNANGTHTIKLFDLNGRQLVNTITEGDKTVISTAHLASGMYILSITDALGIQVYRDRVSVIK